jgi:hypothetical protein
MFLKLGKEMKFDPPRCMCTRYVRIKSNHATCNTHTDNPLINRMMNYVAQYSLYSAFLAVWKKCAQMVVYENQ